MSDEIENFLFGKLKCYFDIPAKLFDWNKSFTSEQKEFIENKIKPFANNLDELADLIEEAGDYIKQDCKWYEGSCDELTRIISFPGYPDYSKDTLVCVQACMLSAKKLRVKLERAIGKEEARNVFNRLRTSLRLCFDGESPYLFVPENRIPPELDNIGASDIAKLIRLKYEEFIKRQDNVFIQYGDRWLVIFEKSQPCYLKHLKGMDYVLQLLRKSPVAISAIKLANPTSNVELINTSNTVECNQDIVNSTEPQEMIDNEALKSYYTRLSEIEIKLEDARGNCDLAEQKELEEEKEEIISCLRSTLTPSGQPRNFSNDIEKARKAVLNAIKRTIDNIEKEIPALSVHLSRSIQTGKHLSYNPEEEIDWEL